MKKLTIKTMNREQHLKVFISWLKEIECQSQKIQLELVYLIDKDNGSKVWFVEAYITDKQNNTVPYRYNCHINGKSNFHDIMSLLVNTGYEICVKSDSPIKMEKECNCCCTKCSQNHEINKRGKCYMCQSSIGQRNSCIEEDNSESFIIPTEFRKEGKYIFFDIDGTLSEHRYNGCVFGDDPEHKLSMENYLFGNVFASNRPIHTMQKLIEKLNNEQVYVLGQMACNHELEEKMYWLDQHFPVIKKENIFFLAEGRKKADFLAAWADHLNIEYKDIILIDDKHEFLKECEIRGFIAYHPSSLIM